jgi:endogenous inhibitor of DNA gyrase (YacG/DUF329 family)
MTGQPTNGTEPSARWVECPTCGGDSIYCGSNAFRPFCCEKCKQLDLGAWASERFALADAAAPIEPSPH